MILRPFFQCFKHTVLLRCSVSGREITKRSLLSTFSRPQLPSDAESARSDFSKSLTARIDKLQTSILFAGKRLNDLTGYSGIEKLKNQIEEQEQIVARSVKEVRDAKQAYAEAIKTRSESQQEVNELLQRKNTWSPTDLERFTHLFRADHSNSRQEEVCQQALNQAEVTADQARMDLGNMILARYHEEQIWSDKIRRASTWGTWGLMGFNILLFILVQLGLEPWKRKRLVGSFEEKVRQVVQEERSALLAERRQTNHHASIENDDFLTDADHAAASVAASVISSLDGRDRPEHNRIISPLSTDDEDFLTDADHAAASVAASTSGPAVDSFRTEQHGAQNRSYPAGEGEASREAGSSIMTNTGQTHSQPRMGNSNMMSLPMSLTAFAATMQQLWRRLDASLTNSARRLTSIWQRAFSEQPCHLRTEDVTSACLASGLIGILFGLSMSQ